MDRIVALILGLLVVLAGFFIVQAINEGAIGIGDSGNSAACIAAGGTCQDTCAGETLDVSCAEGQVCCGAS